MYCYYTYDIVRLNFIFAFFLTSAEDLAAMEAPLNLKKKNVRNDIWERINSVTQIPRGETSGLKKLRTVRTYVRVKKYKLS